VKVLNDTADLYRCFDCTEAAAEFLYACVERTVEQDLTRESTIYAVTTKL